MDLAFVSLSYSVSPAKPFKPVRALGRCQEEACWRKVIQLMKTLCIPIAAILIGIVSGCQCCPLTDCYGNVVDDVNDHHIYFDRVYNPRFDLTRMGKPDWCSPINRMFCWRNCDANGCYDRYDKCNVYPPLYPYEFPSSVMPPPVYRTERSERALDTQLNLYNEATRSPAVPPQPTPEPVPAPTPSPN